MKKIFLSLSFAICISFCNSQTYPAGLKVNDKAPDFSAKDQNGKIISLKDELKSDKVVLIFYRGQWCPYCNKELKSMEDSLSLITSKGATVVAVTRNIIYNSLTKNLKK